jgi:hypothetical protein
MHSFRGSLVESLSSSFRGSLIDSFRGSFAASFVGSFLRALVEWLRTDPTDPNSSCKFFCPVVVEDTGPVRRLQEVIKPKTFKTDVEDGSVRHRVSSGGPRGKPRGRSLKGDDCGKGKGSDSCAPTGKPSEEPSSMPSEEPPSGTATGMSYPTRKPSSKPSEEPSSKPSSKPSEEPSSEPSGTPSQLLSDEPSSVEDSCQACIDQAFPFCPEPVPQAQVCGFFKLLDRGCAAPATYCPLVAAAFPIIGTGSSFCDAYRNYEDFYCEEQLQLAGNRQCTKDCNAYAETCCVVTSAPTSSPIFRR